MKLVSRLIFFIPVIFFGLDTGVLAENLYNEGLFEEAIHEYKRILFFEKDENKKAEIYLRLGVISRENGDYVKSIDYINSFLQIVKNDDEKDNGYIELGLTYLYQTNVNSAIFQFLKVESFSENSGLRKKALFYLILSYVLNHQWDEAEKSFEIFLGLMENKKKKNMENEIERIWSTLKDAKSFKYRSPVVAKWLSTFFFGAGQIYAGNIASGINALALNGLIFYLVIDFFIKADYIDAVFVALSFVERYYSGNIYHAERSAMEYNESHKKKFSNSILKDLEKFSGF